MSVELFNQLDRIVENRVAMYKEWEEYMFICYFFSHFTEIMRSEDFKTFNEQCEKVKESFNEINMKVRTLQEQFRDAGLTDVCLYIDEIQKAEKLKLENTIQLQVLREKQNVFVQSIFDYFYFTAHEGVDYTEEINKLKNKEMKLINEINENIDNIHCEKAEL